MERRQFLAASLAASAVAVTQNSPAQTPVSSKREFYLMRRYDVLRTNQAKLTESFFGEALIPALSRMGMGPVGAFQLEFGNETPAFYVLIPGPSVEALAEVNLRLADDAAFMKAADPFWNATSAAPAFQRAESTLLAAFQGWPKVTPPDTKAKRIFQMRTYESASPGSHVRKVEMFHNGEFEIFLKCGFHPVFFGDTLVGSRMPNLTYMLTYANKAEMDAKWDAFRDDPDWKKLAANPRYASDQLVTNITNLILSPLGCSQI
jgi:hypothetical protein